MDAGVLVRIENPSEEVKRPPEPFVRARRVAPALDPGMAVERSAPVSLIIPTFFNRPLKNGVLRRLLAGLERSSAVREVVLVTADGSLGDGDGLARGRKVVIAACEPNRRAASRNVGASRAAHDLLLFLDDDMLLGDWRLVDVLVSGMLAGGYECALFPRRHYAKYPLLYDEEALDRFVAGWRAAGDAFDDPALIDPVRQELPQRTMAFCFPGCFTLIRREAFDRIGGFPDQYQGWGFEDAAFGMRAIETLRVWNLFRKSPPLLHVDHPVSPYKTDEYYANLRTFRAAHGTIAMDWLCRRAISGEDFAPGAGPRPDSSAYLEPLRCAVAACRLPLGDDLAASYRGFVERRIESRRSPIPEHIVLHGSRAEGTATPESDFDLLALFHEGALSDFFAGREDGTPRVEVEFAELGKYEYIANQPVLHPLFGPIELAKLAKAVVLWGDAKAWDARVGRLLRDALRQGRSYWLLFGLGLALQPGKLGPMRDLFASSLRAVMARVDAEAYREDIEALADPRPEPLAAHLRAVLDREHPGWRRDVAAGRRTFTQQVPAVWMALRRILQGA
jgi:predicted nucleotidyltransferase